MSNPASELLIEPGRLAFLEPVSRLYCTNPFEPEGEELRRTIAGINDAKSFEDRLGTVLGVTAYNLGRGVVGTSVELSRYRAASFYYLWVVHGADLQKLIDDKAVDVPFYDAFVDCYHHLFRRLPLPVPTAPHLLALLYNARRAWYFAATMIPGRSRSAAAARVSMWQASMAGDVETYADGLYRHLDHIPVLITGEPGTGKELAAKCVAWSRYIPFDAGKRRFVRRYDDDFHTRNLCEGPAEIMASTLFGYRRGAFTGATADTPGLFTQPREYGALFLDEIGELPEHLQVALLRPLQSREIVPLGDTHPQPIRGRLLSATNKDLPALCEQGKFRADLYQRLNGMRIHLPPLRQRLAEAPEELEQLVRVFVRKIIDDPASVDRWTERIANAIHGKLFDYPWPGNLRELEHYVQRYILTDGRMAPPAPRPRPNAPANGKSSPPGPAESTALPSSGLLGPAAKEGKTTVEELQRDYVTRVYIQTGMNQTETARRTGINWRTVGRLIDHDRLERLLRRKPKKGDKK